MFDFWGEVAFLKKKAALSVNIRAASDLILIHRSVTLSIHSSVLQRSTDKMYSSNDNTWGSLSIKQILNDSWNLGKLSDKQILQKPLKWFYSKIITLKSYNLSGFIWVKISSWEFLVFANSSFSLKDRDPYRELSETDNIQWALWKFCWWQRRLVRLLQADRKEIVTQITTKYAE